MKNKLIISIIFILLLIRPGLVRADNFLRVYVTPAGSADTLGMAEHFLAFGIKTPVFLPPYTLYFNIVPLPDSSYRAQIDFYELGPAFKNHHFDKDLRLENWQTIEGLESKSLKFDYHLVIFRDTVDYFNYLPRDSLTNFESVHFKAWIWRGSYADYKWEMRKGLLENIYNFYRKEHRVRRSGKIDLVVYPSTYNSPFINNLTGVGFDFNGNSMFTALNESFDSALPQNTQLFVIYEAWGYSARSLAVGYSRYFLDDKYRARSIIAGLTAGDVKAIILDEYPADRAKADIICGAFVRYLADSYGLPQFRKLYENSKPGSFAFKDAYGKTFDEILAAFKDHEKNLRLDESNAYYISSLYNSQMWFDRALEYDVWLGSQPVNKDFHLKGLGASFFHIGDYEESQKTYAAYLKRNQDSAEARYLMGLALLRTGKADQATRFFEEVADSNENAAKMLADIYLNRMDLKNAERYLSRVKEYPDSWTALLKARLAMAQGKDGIAGSITKRALALSNSVITASPGEARGYIDAAYGFMLDRRFAEAESELEIARFVENRPYYLGAANLALGRLFDLKGDRDKAAIYYNKVLEINSSEYLKALAKKNLEKPFKLK